MNNSKKQKKSIYIIKDGKKIIEPELAKYITKVVSAHNKARMKPIK
jgi:hypothetical protein